MSENRVEKAEAEVERARAELIGTIREIADRMEPKKIAGDLWESAKIKGADLAEDAVDAVKERPGLVTGAVTALALFLARDPIKDGIVSLYDKATGAKEEKPKRNVAKPQPKKRSVQARKKKMPDAAGKKVEKKDG